MNMGNLDKKWGELKDQIYYWDGSLRDLYISNIEKEDWELWVNYVNQNYIIKWYNGKTGIEEDQINYDVIREYLNGEHDLCSSAKIFIDKVRINCHFFSHLEIENDLDPREINALEDHEKIVKYMTDLAVILRKEVVLTPENEPQISLMNVKNECQNL